MFLPMTTRSTAVATDAHEWMILLADCLLVEARAAWVARVLSFSLLWWPQSTIYNLVEVEIILYIRCQHTHAWYWISYTIYIIIILLLLWFSDDGWLRMRRAGGAVLCWWPQSIYYYHVEEVEISIYRVLWGPAYWIHHIYYHHSTTSTMVFWW